MSQEIILPKAIDFVISKLHNPVTAAQKKSGYILRLKWASRVTWIDEEGNKSDLGARFFLSWSSPDLEPDSKFKPGRFLASPIVA